MENKQHLYRSPFQALIFALLLTILTVDVHACAFAKIVRVIDGDTLVATCNGVEQKIRLYGVDCPELDQPFGEKAKQFASEQLSKQPMGVMELGKDSYNLIIAEVILHDRRVLNHELVKYGLAWWYRKYALKNTALKNLEKDAMRAKLGLWSEDNLFRLGSGEEMSRIKFFKNDRF